MTSKATTTLAQTLMRMPSITPDDAGCQLFLAQKLKALGFHCEHLRFGDTDNLFARYGTEEPLFVFAGHTDVVPTGPENEWQSPPFAAEIHHGNIIGRGACDMKSAIAAMVVATERFIQQQPHFHGSIAFLLTSDEEGTAVNGTKKVIELLQQRNTPIQYCVIGEPSSDQCVGDQIRVGRRGSLHGKLIIHGKQGHVAHPHLAKNPIHLGALALHELATNVWDTTSNDAFPPTTFQISNLHSGTGAANVIPGHLEVLFNFRYGTAVTTDELKQRTEQCLRKHGLSFDLTWDISALPFLTPRGKLLTVTQAAIKSVTDQTTRLSTGGGTSDGRFIAPTGAELVELGVSHATAHQIDESVSIDELEKLTDIYELILKQIFAIAQ